MARVKTAYKPKAYRDGGAVSAHDVLPVPPVDVERNDVAGDDAASAFRQQIDALQGAEDIHRQRALQARQEAEVQKVLAAFPEMARHPALVAEAEREAFEAGHAPYSAVFHEAVKNSFHAKLAAKNSPPPSPLMEHEIQTYDLPEKRNNNSFVSAPVSREVPSASYPERPGTIRLSVEQKDMARRLGITEREYAEGLLEMRQRDKDYGR